LVTARNHEFSLTLNNDHSEIKETCERGRLENNASSYKIKLFGMFLIFIFSYFSHFSHVDIIVSQGINNVNEYYISLHIFFT